MIAKYIARVEQVRANPLNDTPDRIAFQLECVDAIHLPAIEVACKECGFVMNAWIAYYETCKEVVKEAEIGRYTHNFDFTDQQLWTAERLGMDVSEARQALLRNAKNGEAVFPSSTPTLMWAQRNTAIHQQA